MHLTKFGFNWIKCVSSKPVFILHNIFSIFIEHPLERSNLSCENTSPLNSKWCWKRPPPFSHRVTPSEAANHSRFRSAGEERRRRSVFFSTPLPSGGDRAHCAMYTSCYLKRKITLLTLNITMHNLLRSEQFRFPRFVLCMSNFTGNIFLNQTSCVLFDWWLGSGVVLWLVGALGFLIQMIIIINTYHNIY